MVGASAKRVGSDHTRHRSKKNKEARTVYFLLISCITVNPIVSSEEADIICFTVTESPDSLDGAHGETVWMVEINTRTKTLLSVIRSDNEELC